MWTISIILRRGYENLDEKLRGLGAKIEKVASEKEIPEVPSEGWLTGTENILYNSCKLEKINDIRKSYIPKWKRRGFNR